MIKLQFLKKMIVFVITLVLISGCCIPAITGSSFMNENQSDFFVSRSNETEGKTDVTCIAFGKTRDNKQNVALTKDDVTMIFNMLRELKSEMTSYPFSEKTQALKKGFVDALDEKGLIPNKISKEIFLSLLNPPRAHQIQNKKEKASVSQQLLNQGTCALCSIGGEGRGLLVPLFLIPRPRIAMMWFSSDAITQASNLITSRGYIAGGEQTGFALGFIGIGISYSIPGITFFGFIGYSLFAFTTAEYMEYYPPNNPPKITAVFPLNGATQVSTDITELSFSLSDTDNNLMSYSVTTSPDIGGGNGNLKPDGNYTIPVSGLQSSSKYTWHVQASDGKDTVEKDFTFTTVTIAPEISNPFPEDQAQFIPTTTSFLSFMLHDYQGDLIDWTVQTSPSIGSGSGTEFSGGVCSVPIAGLDYETEYTWYVNATDGAHWNRKIFTFTTSAKGQFMSCDDSMITDTKPNANSGDEPTFQTRAHPGWIAECLVSFNISSLPQNATIHSATLRLYYTRNADGNPAGRLLNLYRLTSPWNEETVTWNNQPSSQEDPTAAAYVPDHVNEWISWDVTQDVILFQSGAAQNYGWKVADDEDLTSFTLTYLRTKEYGENIPILQIDYD